MSNSDYKLILTRSSDDKAEIRYRKTTDVLWQTLCLNENNLDLIINKILKGIESE